MGIRKTFAVTCDHPGCDNERPTIADTASEARYRAQDNQQGITLRGGPEGGAA